MMSNTQENSPGGPARGKVRSSLVLRLNGRFFLRLLGLFISMDILLALTAAVVVVGQAEKTAESVFAAAGRGWSSEQAQVWLTELDAQMTRSPFIPDGRRLPAFIFHSFPGVSAEAQRYISLPEAYAQASILQRLSALVYRVRLNVGGTPILLSLSLAGPVRLCFTLFIVLWAIQLLMLLKWIVSGSRSIRKVLRPIEDLARTAHSLNQAGRGSFTPEEMETLAGKIDGITASRLDTRIPLDGTQEELKELALAINGMLERINASYRAQVRFVSDASHELRTPISVIQGYANLLDRWGKKDEKTLQESIDAIKDEAAGMKAMVEQLLFLARGDSNTITLQMECFSLAELAEQVYKEARMIDPGHEYTCSSQPVTVYADEALIKQALRILTDNAMKYTPAGGQIAITLSGQDSQAVLTVQDEGIGIAPEALPRIFDRFYRADDSRARATGGTGLGLSIAEWIAERHGGHLEALSREGIGTRMSLVLPVTEKDAQPPHSGKPDKSGQEIRSAI